MGDLGGGGSGGIVNRAEVLGDEMVGVGDGCLGGGGGALGGIGSER